MTGKVCSSLHAERKTYIRHHWMFRCLLLSEGRMIVLRDLSAYDRFYVGVLQPRRSLVMAGGILTRRQFKVDEYVAHHLRS